MVKTYIKLIIYALCVCALTALSILYALTKKQNIVYAQRIERQDVIIDSLIARKMHVFDVKMTVTDKSKSIVYGKYNKGQINMPTEKIYVLDFDTLSLNGYNIK